MYRRMVPNFGKSAPTREAFCRDGQDTKLELVFHVATVFQTSCKLNAPLPDLTTRTSSLPRVSAAIGAHTTLIPLLAAALLLQ